MHRGESAAGYELRDRSVPSWAKLSVTGATQRGFVSGSGPALALAATFVGLVLPNPSPLHVHGQNFM